MYVLANRNLELSCDETVACRFGGARTSYANMLIRMEETKSELMPLCNHFSKNAVEERITAIMKTKKATILSLVLAAVLVVGTVTAFAASARKDGAGTETTAADGSAAKPDQKFLDAGLAYRNYTWFYQGEAVAGMYDDNGGTYNDVGVSDIYFAIKRGSNGKITEPTPITKKQFVELADRHINLTTDSTEEEDTLMSYVNPDDGKTYYSFDDGKAFEPQTDAEFGALYPTPNIEWWTYDEFNAWLDEEKVRLQSIVVETGEVNGRKFTWTQEEIGKTIVLYPEMLAAVKPFCEKQVKLGNMRQSEANEILSRYTENQKAA